jgi:F-type H+-transporting ATPase subunit gamma
MPNLRDIRSRIKSVKNTGQITRAMQLVAASKMKRAQEAVFADRPYAILLAELLGLIGQEVDPSKIRHPLFQKRDVKTRGIVLLSTDKGLCGGLNANLFKTVTQIDSPAAYVTVGRKATQFISRTQRQLLGSFEVPDIVEFKHLRPVLDLMLEAFEKGEVDSIEVIFPRFVNTIIQEPEVLPLVPVTDLSAQTKAISEKIKVQLARGQDEREFLFEPSTDEMIARLVEMYLRHRLFHLVLETRASEHSARMVAMKAATDNAKNLVDDLTLSYNKARQAAITQEILEISAASQFN